MERFMHFILITSGLGFVACAVWLVATPAHAAPVDELQRNTLGYCEARASLALLIIKDAEDGTPLANINIHFQQPPATPELQRAREEWVEALKVEIAAAMQAVPRELDEWQQRVGQKIIEKCWYDYGKQRRHQSAAPGTLLHAASSQAIATPETVRFNQCSAQLVDEIHAGNMLGTGRFTPDELRAGALEAADELGLERFDHVMHIIDAAEAAQQQGRLQAWFDALWRPCMDGR